MSKRRVLLVAINLLVVGVAASGASAHTEADVVAVPAGSEATVTLKPTHGCGSSPTVEVAIQAPVEGAVAADVAGWQATSTDGDGTTVLEWTGGSLAADQVGAFPVSFSVPDSVGELLTFPAVQVCANGEELAWISGDPADEYPAPRLLVLAPGTPAATSIDQVPADAPGRASLTEVVDVDNPASNTTSTTSTTTEPTSTTTDPPEAPDPAEESDSSDDSASGWLVVGAGVLALGAGAGVVWMRRRGKQA